MFYSSISLSLYIFIYIYIIHNIFYIIYIWYIYYIYILYIFPSLDILQQRTLHFTPPLTIAIRCPIARQTPCWYIWMIVFVALKMFCQKANVSQHVFKTQNTSPLGAEVIDCWSILDDFSSFISIRFRDLLNPVICNKCNSKTSF